MVHFERSDNVTTTHITQPLWCACYSAHWSPARFTATQRIWNRTKHGWSHS